MPDLLTHILIVYILYRPTSWYVDALSDRYLGIAMIGSVLPDLAKVRLVVPIGQIEQILGQELVVAGVHRLGPILALAGIGAMLFEPQERRVVFGWLTAGAGLHFVLDLTVKRAGGVAPPYLYPLTWWEPPSFNLLLSSVTWPWVLATVLAVGVWGVDFWMKASE